MYVKGLLIWILLWFSAFSVNAIMIRIGIPLHGTYGTSLVLALRDLTILALSFWLWSTWFPEERSQQKWRFSTLDRINLVLVLVVTAAYFIRLINIGEHSSPSSQIIEQLQYRTPFRVMTLVSFQQILTTFFLLDLNRRRWGDERGLVIAAATFAGSHLFGVVINNPPTYALLITPACFIGFWFWGRARLRWASPWTPFLTHALFYLGALLGQAFQWF